MKICWSMGLAALFLHISAIGQESFPGQNDLAAGLSCFGNLDHECALSRLQKALGEFSPEKDPNFIEHVCKARMVLAMIFISSDDLMKAEQEFKNLLLIQPNFQLPSDDYPPKVLYIFERAKDSQKKKSLRPPTGKQGIDQSQPDIKQTDQADAATTQKAIGTDRVSSPDTGWYISPEGRVVILFGDDADSFSSGPGASLATGMQLSPAFSLQLSFDFAYHPSVIDSQVLRSMALNMECLVRLSLSPFSLRLGGGAGVLSMGTGNRYDHWGLNTQLTIAAVWPETGWWAIVISAHPSWLITKTDSSFYLPLGFSGEIRW